MNTCQACVWFDAPADAYIGLCQLWQSQTACNHRCAKFAPLPQLATFDAPPPSAPAPVQMRTCRACGHVVEAVVRTCPNCHRPWWY